MNVNLDDLVYSFISGKIDVSLWILILYCFVAPIFAFQLYLWIKRNYLYFSKCKSDLLDMVHKTLNYPHDES